MHSSTYSTLVVVGKSLAWALAGAAPRTTRENRAGNIFLMENFMLSYESNQADYAHQRRRKRTAACVGSLLLLRPLPFCWKQLLCHGQNRGPPQTPANSHRQLDPGAREDASACGL